MKEIQVEFRIGTELDLPYFTVDILKLLLEQAYRVGQLVSALNKRWSVTFHVVIMHEALQYGNTLKNASTKKQTKKLMYIKQ